MTSMLFDILTIYCASAEFFFYMVRVPRLVISWGPTIIRAKGDVRYELKLAYLVYLFSLFIYFTYLHFFCKSVLRPGCKNGCSVIHRPIH